MKKWSHDELMRDLASHLSGAPNRMLWMDMQLGPSGSPRPDVYTINKSYVKPNPVAYEIKVSTSDYRSDVTTGKWQAYLKYASGVFFAVPSGLVSKQDLPNGCGLIVRGEHGWRVIKAPVLSRVAIPQGAMLKLLIDGVRLQGLKEKNLHFNSAVAHKKIKSALGNDVALAVSDLSEARNLLAALQARNDNLDKECKKIIGEAKAYADKIIQAAREDRERELKEVSRIAETLYEFLGVEPGAPLHRLRSSAADLRKSLSADERIQRCEYIISNLKRSVESFVDTFPSPP